MFIIRNKRIFFSIATLLVLGSVVAMVFHGFQLGVDFTGGSVLEVAYETRPNIDAIKSSLLAVRPDARIQAIGSNGVMVRTEPIDETVKESLLSAMKMNDQIPTEKRFNTIGPSVGSELRSKALLSVILVSLCIIIFIAFAFRGVARKEDKGGNATGVSSWKYGVIAIAVLIHDVVIPAGVFAFFGLQVDTLFIVGLLTILGVSVNDTIVVFDRIRENLHVHEEKKTHETFEEIVGKSIQQTFTRSLMTSLTVLLALAALWVWGPESTRTLSIAMFLGVFFGTYSSIFIASPLLVVWEKWQNRKKV